MADQPELPGRSRFYIIGVLSILVIEYGLRVLLLPAVPSDNQVGITVALEWLAGLVLVFYWIPEVERQPLRSIGWGPFRWRYLWLSALAYVLSLVGMVLAGMGLEAMGLESTRALQSKVQLYSPATLLGLFLTGTILEEVFYRGYLIERLTSLLRCRWAAGLLSWIVFTFVHLRFFGLGPTLNISVLSGALVLLYLRERSLWPPILLHGLNGVFSYWIFPALAR